MALLVTDCPHCGMGKTGFPIFGYGIWPEATRERGDTNQFGYFIKANISASCPECHKPTCATIKTKTTFTMPQKAEEALIKALKEPTSISSLGFMVLEVWPSAIAPRVPTHLAPATESAFLQAERAFARGDADAAGMMYRRALETGLKVTFPNVTGSLYARITTLVASHELPPALGEWAHEVRVIGNEAAHDIEALSSEDMAATRNFVDAVLRYAISLPKEIELRRMEINTVETDSTGNLVQ